jgi:hypothetical protein
MVMRLGFSVAMCVDPDILLIDEVLAVGDEAFQNKCFNRLEGFKASRKTLVLVTHSMEMVKNFCSRAVLLQKGRLVEDGDPVAVIDKYHEILSTKERDLDLEREIQREKIAFQPVEEMERPEKREEEEQEKYEEKAEKEEIQEKERGELEEVVPEPPQYRQYGTLEAEITEVLIKSSEKGKEIDTFLSGEMVSICLRIRCHQDIENPAVGMVIMKFDEGCGVLIYNTNTLWRNMNLGCFNRGVEFEVHFNQRVSLPEGRYYLNVGIANTDASRVYDWRENVKSFQIMTGDFRWKGTVDLNSQIIVVQ